VHHCCSGKAISITYSECVSVAYLFSTQRARAVLYCHQWHARKCNIFQHYLINDTIFEKKVNWTQVVFGFYLQRWSETFLILRRIQRDIVNVHYAPRKVPVIIGRFKKKRVLLRDFRKLSNIKFHKNPSRRRRIALHAGRQPDMTKADIIFSQFFLMRPKLWTRDHVTPRNISMLARWGSSFAYGPWQKTELLPSCTLDTVKDLLVVNPNLRLQIPPSLPLLL